MYIADFVWIAMKELFATPKILCLTLTREKFNDVFYVKTISEDGIWNEDNKVRN